MTYPPNAIHSLLSAARARFAPVSTSASLDAQLLMAHVLDMGRAHVIAHPERVLTEAEVCRFEVLVDRRATGEPMAYIFGRRAFYDRDFIVTPDVLIPRPETELLVEAALASAQARRPEAVAADIGTGSGAIAVTFGALCPHARVYAVDVSAAALDVARQNAARHDVPVRFLHGDLLAPLLAEGITVDLLLANLPYIATGEMAALDVSRHEPHLALDGGADGLDLLRRLLADAPAVLRPQALVLLEIGADQGETARDLVREALGTPHVDILRDLAGLDRIIQAVCL